MPSIIANVGEKMLNFSETPNDDEDEDYAFEWRNFLYGSLAGIGVLTVVFALGYVFIFKCSAKFKSNEYEMGTYLDDSVAK
jgi:hypothetical protein